GASAASYHRGAHALYLPALLDGRRGTIALSSALGIPPEGAALLGSFQHPSGARRRARRDSHGQHSKWIGFGLITLPTDGQSVKGICIAGIASRSTTAKRAPGRIPGSK